MAAKRKERWSAAAEPGAAKLEARLRELEQALERQREANHLLEVEIDASDVVIDGRAARLVSGCTRLPWTILRRSRTISPAVSRSGNRKPTTCSAVRDGVERDRARPLHKASAS